MYGGEGGKEKGGGARVNRQPVLVGWDLGTMRLIWYVFDSLFCFHEMFSSHVLVTDVLCVVVTVGAAWVCVVGGGSGVQRCWKGGGGGGGDGAELSTIEDV